MKLQSVDFIRNLNFNINSRRGNKSYSDKRPGLLIKLELKVAASQS